MLVFRQNEDITRYKKNPQDRDLYTHWTIPGTKKFYSVGQLVGLCYYWTCRMHNNDRKRPLPMHLNSQAPPQSNVDHVFVLVRILPAIIIEPPFVQK